MSYLQRRPEADLISFIFPFDHKERADHLEHAKKIPTKTNGKARALFQPLLFLCADKLFRSIVGIAAFTDGYVIAAETQFNWGIATKSLQNNRGT